MNKKIFENIEKNRGNGEMMKRYEITTEEQLEEMLRNIKRMNKIKELALRYASDEDTIKLIEESIKYARETIRKNTSLAIGYLIGFANATKNDELKKEIFEMK